MDVRPSELVMDTELLHSVSGANWKVYVYCSMKQRCQLHIHGYTGVASPNGPGGPGPHYFLTFLKVKAYVGPPFFGEFKGPL